MKKSIVLSFITALLAMPAVTLAYVFIPDAPPNNVPINILGVLAGVFNLVWPITVAVIIIMFIYAGFQFLTAQGDPSKIAAARQSVIWGAAGVAVILLAFSMITIIRITIGGGI
ncbi:hypothetical protein KW786_01530 [Candidatus Parcubacteria bacterium]|nr:hypothetical protein [Candidatus Parcubacteria bacterium]